MYLKYKKKDFCVDNFLIWNIIYGYIWMEEKFYSINF